MSANFKIIVIFPIYGQIWAIQNPDFERMVYISEISITNKLLSKKNWKQN